MVLLTLYCRFFTPTINYLSLRGCNLHILCMSTGKAIRIFQFLLQMLNQQISFMPKFCVTCILVAIYMSLDAKENLKWKVYFWTAWNTWTIEFLKKYDPVQAVFLNPRFTLWIKFIAVFSFNFKMFKWSECK